MTEAINEALCRVYSITCPACGYENRFSRLKRDIHRTREQEPDGHPTRIAWMADGEFPEWLTPLNYFWGVCERCCYAGQLDDPDFRQWEKNAQTAKKYRAMYREGALEFLEGGADSGQGVLQILRKGLQPNDPFSSALAQFFTGIFIECLKNSPVPGNLARSYLRIAWLYRDEARLYGEFAPQSNIRAILEEAAEAWNEEIPPNDNYPAVPALVTNEVDALRFALAYFEWNFRALEKAGHEDEMRLMSLIAEIGYRIYELTGTDEDFKKGQTLFSGAMQKCLSIINDKSIVGGAVNRAKDSLEKAGDRGRELRLLKQKRDKGIEPMPNPTAPPPLAPPKPPRPAAPEASESEPEPGPEPAPVPHPAPAGLEGSVESLKQKITQLDEENKRWMRLAGISQLTGLPNRVMLSRVLLPSALKQAISRHETLGCLLVAPEGMREINGKYGRARGDLLLKKVSLCLKSLLKRGERLSHPDGINFLVIVPTIPLHQLRKRAEILRKDLTSRRFDLEGETISLNVSIGVAGLDDLNKNVPTKALQEALYANAVTALDTAKLKGSSIEVFDGKAASR